MTIEETKEFLRIDGNDEDLLIQSLLTAAESYLTNAGVTVTTGALYDLAVKLLVSHWYENREAVLIGNISKTIEFSLSTILTQLKYCYPETTESGGTA